MRRLTVLTAFIVLSLVFAQQAQAATTIPVKVTFTQPVIPAVKSGDCAVFPEGFCGMGQVIPFGHATETIDLHRGDIQRPRMPRGLPVEPRLPVVRNADGCDRRRHRHLRGGDRNPDGDGASGRTAEPDQALRQHHARRPLNR